MTAADEIDFSEWPFVYLVSLFENLMAANTNRAQKNTVMIINPYIFS